MAAVTINVELAGLLQRPPAATSTRSFSKWYAMEYRTQVFAEELI